MAVTVEKMNVAGQLCINIAEAARRVGCSHSKLYRDIRSGKLPVIEDDEGNRVIEPGELARIYHLDEDAADSVGHDDPSIIATLQDEIATLRARIEQLETEDTVATPPPVVTEAPVAEPPPSVTTADTNETMAAQSSTKRSGKGSYSRKSRSRSRRLKRFVVKMCGVLALVLVTTGIVIAFTHIISLGSS